MLPSDGICPLRYKRIVAVALFANGEICVRTVYETTHQSTAGTHLGMYIRMRAIISAVAKAAAGQSAMKTSFLVGTILGHENV